MPGRRGRVRERGRGPVALWGGRGKGREMGEGRQGGEEVRHLSRSPPKNDHSVPHLFTCPAFPTDLRPADLWRRTTCFEKGFQTRFTRKVYFLLFLLGRIIPSNLVWSHLTASSSPIRCFLRAAPGTLFRWLTLQHGENISIRCTVQNKKIFGK